MFNRKSISILMVFAMMFPLVIAFSSPKSTSSLTSGPQWFSSANTGLMVHWGLGTGNRADQIKYTSIADFEAATKSWSAAKWVNEAKKMRAKFITFASFHSCIGYLRAWNTSIPGTPHTNRDYLGELITAAHAENIKVIVYITTSLNHVNSYTPGNIPFYIDVQGYKNYKKAENPGLTDAQLESSYNISNNFGFGAFSFDIVKELAQNYAVDGFWYDAHGNPTWWPADQYPWAGGYPYDKGTKYSYDAATFATNYFGPRNMNAFVHNLSPGLLTFYNNFRPTLPTDIIGKENWDQGPTRTNWKIMNTSDPTVTNRENLFIPSGNWWYDGVTVSTVDNQLQVKRIVNSITAGAVATISEGPTITGDFPQAIADYNNFLDNFFTWSYESLLSSVIPGGHDKGGFPAGDWDNGAYGGTTLNPVTNTHYLHILTAPSSNTLSLSDSGYKVTSAVDLRTGANLSFSQSNGKLTVTIPDWSTLDIYGDQVIKLTVYRNTIIPH